MTNKNLQAERKSSGPEESSDQNWSNLSDDHSSSNDKFESHAKGNGGKKKKSSPVGKKLKRSYNGATEPATSTDEKIAFECKVCPRKVITAKALRAHLKSVHELQDETVLNVAQKFHLFDRRKEKNYPLLVQKK